MPKIAKNAGATTMALFIDGLHELVFVDAPSGTKVGAEGWA